MVSDLKTSTFTALCICAYSDMHRAYIRALFVMKVRCLGQYDNHATAELPRKHSSIPGMSK